MDTQPTVSGNENNVQQDNQTATEPPQTMAAGAIPVPSVPIIPPEFVIPHAPYEIGHAMVRAPFPYPDPYFPGLVAAYGPQPIIHPHMIGVPHTGVPLPSDAIEEPVYVNAKQYHGIMRRRQSRAKAESENKLIKSRKPYLHESRHLHALKRARGCGGRFLNAKKNSSHQDEVSKENGSRNDKRDEFSSGRLDSGSRSNSE